MIMSTLGLILIFILRMVYGELAAHYFPVLQEGIVYTDVVMGIVAGLYALYLVSVLARKLRGDMAPGIIRCTVAFAAVLAFFVACEVSKGTFSFLAPYETVYIVGFAVFALFYVLMLIFTLIGHMRERRKGR